MKRILIISAFAPCSNTAGQAFTARLLADIGSSSQVGLCYFYSDSISPFTPTKNVTNISATHLTLFKRIIGALSLPFLHPIFTTRFSYATALHLRAVARNYDIILFDFSQVFIYSLFIRHPKKIAMAHDIISQMYERKKGFLAVFNQVFSRFSENFVLKRLSVDTDVYCFSDKDCKISHDYFGITARQVDFYLDDHIYSLNWDRVVHHDKFVFYGAWGRRENSSGLLWFLHNVMPLIGKQCRFIVIGSGVTGELLKAAQPYGDSLEFVGFVQNPYELLAGAKALVAPLFEGAGVKVKVVEALACGIPVIGTDTSLEGISIKPEYSCAICNTVVQFADSLNKFTVHDKYNARKIFLCSYPIMTMGQIMRDVCDEE